ncbi:MAG: hypothetical protein J5770_03595 [Bacteroidaceae bacterium]|nr:hypothetical protein [Bacteroidaceae bacterium]
MKIDNQDIIRTARQLRDEENEQLHVCPEFNYTRPWRHVPSWLIAIPAAAVIGFFIGLWTQAGTENDAPLTALVDTVYIKVPASQPPQDTVTQVVPAAPAPAPRQTAHASAKSRNPQPSIGRSVADDHIRYDLLVRN